MGFQLLCANSALGSHDDQLHRNQKHSGFLPEERAWMDELFGPAGFVDAFRAVNGEADQYTWWSNRGQAWAKNVGWRIDYQVTTKGLRSKITGARIYKTRRFSDHAPLIIDYDYTPVRKRPAKGGSSTAC